MIEALIETYRRSTPSVRRRGRSWYPEARRRLERLARENERPLAQAVAVFAITSIDAQLRTNFRFTEGVLRGERRAGRYPTFQEPLIRSALATRYPGRFVRGPKCNAFYRAIMGETEALVLDRWSARAAGLQLGKRRDLNVTIRRELDDAYREAARLCGESVRAFQAIVWIVTRESTPTKRGARRLPDFGDF
jgi:hypothetical protein